VVVVLSNGSGRHTAPFYFLNRGVMTVAAVAHAEFKFYGCVRVSEGGGVGCPNWFWVL